MEYKCVMYKPNQNPDLITNFKKDELSIYEEVVKIWGDDVFIMKDAYWLNGYRDPELCALQKKTGVDIDKKKLFALICDIAKHEHGTDVL